MKTPLIFFDTDFNAARCTWLQFVFEAPGHVIAFSLFLWEWLPRRFNEFGRNCWSDVRMVFDSEEEDCVGCRL